MSADVMHMSRVVRLADMTITGTLCNRNRTTRDGTNITELQRYVTCKWCLKKLGKASRRAKGGET